MSLDTHSRAVCVCVLHAPWFNLISDVNQVILMGTPVELHWIVCITFLFEYYLLFYVLTKYILEA